MVNAATFSSGAALLSLGLSVYETLLAQTIGALLLVIGLCLNAAAGVKHLGEVHRDLMTWWMVYDDWRMLGIKSPIANLVESKKLTSW